MAKYKKFEIPQYNDIMRGTSLTIPVSIKRVDGTPFDLTDAKLHFTLKKMQFDHDYDDERALISKEIVPDEEMAADGRCNIRLSSKDTWLHPGEYYFDIEVIRGHAVNQIAFYKVEIVGVPTNMTVDHEEDDRDYLLGQAIQSTPTPNGPIQITTALVPDPPKNIIETVEGRPGYIVHKLDDPVRNLVIQSYAPRASVAMNIRVAHDTLDHAFRFENAMAPIKMDNACPLKGLSFHIRNRDIRIETTKKMKMSIADMYVQHSPEVTMNGDYQPDWNMDEYFHLGDNVTVGTLHIQLQDGNDMIDLHGSYQIHDDHDGFSYFMLRADWFNWVDEYDCPYAEEDDEEEGISKHNCEMNRPDNDPVWPPEIHYGIE